MSAALSGRGEDHGSNCSGWGRLRCWAGIVRDPKTGHRFSIGSCANKGWGHNPVETDRIVIPVADLTHRAGRREGRQAAASWLRRRCCAPASTLVGLRQYGTVRDRGAPAAVRAKPNRTVAQTPASEREHERILSSYGGAYDDPRLEALIGKTVDRLVAASDRPDQAYKVTILNSGAVNAFALPTGQLYVTRGLIALASDTSELSSVLAHEMAHVLAKHASIREDQARQAAVVTRVVTDMSNDPDLTALALAKTKLTMASFSRAQEFEADGIGVGISARAHFDPYGAVALPDRDGAQRGAEGRQDLARSARAGLPVVASGDAGARAERAGQRAAIHLAAGRRARPRDLSRRDRQHRLWRGPQRRFRARPALPASQARLHLCRARHLHARQHRAGGDRRARGRHPGDALRRGARAGRAVARRLSQLRLDGGRRQGFDRGAHHQRLPGGVRDRAAATSGSSGSTRCASAATSTASSSPPSRRPPKASATRARPSTRSAA